MIYVDSSGVAYVDGLPHPRVRRAPRPRPRPPGYRAKRDARLTVLAVFAVLGCTTVLGNVLVAFPVAAFFLALLWRRRKAVERATRKTGFSYHLYSRTLEFLGAFTLVAAIYSALSLWLIAAVTDATDLDHLVRAEVFLHGLKRYTAVIKLTPIKGLLVTGAVYGLCLAAKPDSKLPKGWKLYGKAVKFVTIAATLAASFSLIAIDPFPGGTDPQLRIAALRSEYESLERDVFRTLSARVTDRLLRDAAADPRLQSLRARLDSVQVRAKPVLESYALTREAFGVTHPVLDEALRRSRGERTAPPEPFAASPGEPAAPPGDVSLQSVRAARKDVPRAHEPGEAGPAAVADAAGEMAAKLVDVPTTPVKKQFVEMVGGTDPTLRFIAEVVADAITDHLKGPVRELARRIARASARGGTRGARRRR